MLLYNHSTTELALKGMKNHEIAVELITNVSKELNNGETQYGEVSETFSKKDIVSLPIRYVSILKGIGRHVNNKKGQLAPTFQISNNLPLFKLLKDLVVCLSNFL